MQPVPTQEMAPELETLVQDIPEPKQRRLRPVHVAVGGLLGVACIAVVSSAFSGTHSPPSMRTEGFEEIIQKFEGAPACENEDTKCHGCSGAQCSSCHATVRFNCCMHNATDDDDRHNCCTNDHYNAAQKGGMCDAHFCPTFDKQCHGCSGQSCTGCNATVNFYCCLSKSLTQEGDKACCSDPAHKLAQKGSNCAHLEDDTVVTACAVAGKGCLASRCCQDPDLTCYSKNEHWADCKATCAPGKVDPNSPKDQQSPWNCSVLTRCSDAGAGCKDTGCCNDQSLTCYEKNEHWSDCKATCEAGKVDPNSPKDQQSPWTCKKKCSVAGQGCKDTGCCADPNLKCFVKNEHWSDCKASCEKGKVDPNSPKDQQSPWSCDVMTMK